MNDINRIQEEHARGEHWDGPVMDCIPCVEEWVALGGKDEMGVLINR